jgi:hypothetical protein
MVKLSVVIPVHNEIKLIGTCLKYIKSHIHECILVDGNGVGPSSDGTVEAAKGQLGDKLRCADYVGVEWSKSSAIDQGLKMTSGDWVMQLSADMMVVGLESILALLENKQYDRICSNYVDLWCDAKHAKGITYKPLIVQSSILRGNSNQKFKDISALPLWVYHVGWLRSFEQQVAKHIRNLQAGAWDELGDDVLMLGEQAAESWCVHHIMGYSISDHTIICPHESVLADFKDWSPENKMDEYIAAYEEKYKVGFYQGIMNSVPPNLIRK